LLPGRRQFPFPAFFCVEEKPVTFRVGEAVRCREEREAYVFDWLARLRKARRLIGLLIPNEIYSNGRTAIFHAGWTLTERAGEIRTHQCVVFLSGEAVPLGRSDQGVIAIASRTSLSAWNGRTHEQSQATAA
jgi:hypothetical protein